jgi:hypothetical protein
MTKRMTDHTHKRTALQDESSRKIVLRGLAFIPLAYAIVQAEQWLVGKPYEWFGDTQFIVAVFMPVLLTIVQLLQYRRFHERPKL